MTPQAGRLNPAARNCSHCFVGQVGREQCISRSRRGVGPGQFGQAGGQSQRAAQQFERGAARHRRALRGIRGGSAVVSKSCPALCKTLTALSKRSRAGGRASSRAQASPGICGYQRSRGRSPEPVVLGRCALQTAGAGAKAGPCLIRSLLKPITVCTSQSKSASASRPTPRAGRRASRNCPSCSLPPASQATQFVLGRCLVHLTT